MVNTKIMEEKKEKFMEIVLSSAFPIFVEPIKICYTKEVGESYGMLISFQLN